MKQIQNRSFFYLRRKLPCTHFLCICVTLDTIRICIYNIRLVASSAKFHEKTIDSTSYSNEIFIISTPTNEIQ